jgi:epsilon-lactone hydrolase
MAPRRSENKKREQTKKKNAPDNGVVSSTSSAETSTPPAVSPPEQAAATAPAPVPVSVVARTACGNGDDDNVKNHQPRKAKNVNTTARRTVVVHPPCGPPYIRCESLEPFLANGDPMLTVGAQEEQAKKNTNNKNKEEEPPPLNLNLGQPRFSPDQNPRLVWMIKFLSLVLVEWWEHLFYKVWNTVVPLGVKRRLVFWSWTYFYLPLHQRLLGRRTAIHRDGVSLEYHALSTILYWGRFFPISVKRMRFALSQLHVYMPPSSRMTAARVEHIQEPVDVNVVMPRSSTTSSTANNTVQGIFLHRYADSAKTTDFCNTIFWIYGGAFLAGDAPGNAAIADWVGHETNMNVFIPTIRLAPEADMDAILYDVCLAYRWLCQRLQKQLQEQPGESCVGGRRTIKIRPRIQLLGISSGGALCTRLMQLIAEHERGEDIVPAILKPLLACNEIKMPSGAVLLGPFVDYTPAKGSLLECAKHDLVVHDRVLESGLPFLETHIPAGQRHEYSPALRNCHGLPPLCVVVSMHEAVFDMTVTLINRARNDGVFVTVGCWKYMCHVFSFLQAFIPEGRVSMEFLAEWMRQRNAQCEEEQEKDDETAAAAATGVTAEGKDSN